MRTYQCGHSELINGTAPTEIDTLDITSIDGKKLFPFQLEGARFIEKSGMRCLVADEMGLGKTVQAIATVAAHREETIPFFQFVKSGLRVQWLKEDVRWGDLTVQIIDDANSFFIPGMDGYIISMDTAWRIGHKVLKDKKGKVIDYIAQEGKTIWDIAVKLGVKLVVIDECQMIKNPTSKRTKAIVRTCGNVKHIIALSGTPIKNNAGEYFTILNILRPDKFPTESGYIYGWCDNYFDGYKSKIGGLKSPEKFHEHTKDFIIRRDRKTVLPDLPLIWRQFQFCELGKMVEDMYAQTMREFNDAFDSDEGTSFEKYSNLMAYLAKMRHLAGLAKIDPIVEYVEEFCMSTPVERKIVIFTHHKDVMETIAHKLTKFTSDWPAEYGRSVLQIRSDMDSYARDEALQTLKLPTHRILLASTLASGEGLNMQFVSDCIMAERQWNPANEEQAEARFPRPGQTADKINATYFVAVGTVDEFFSELVEKKREIMQSTLDGKATMKWDESSLMTELMGVLRQKGGKKWGF
jgi:SWI/SNF-related matrix-associated actin-dependent regulator 1 of chromatin subfamily A